ICVGMNIPLYYFVDDNFLLLTRFPEFAGHTFGKASAALEPFKGILCGSATLARAFGACRLHPNIMEMWLVFDVVKFEKNRQVPIEKRSVVDLRLGFVGGDFRRKNLSEKILPALDHICDDTTLELCCGFELERGNERYAVRKVDADLAFDEFLVRWRVLALDVILHHQGDTENIDSNNAQTH